MIRLSTRKSLSLCHLALLTVIVTSTAGRAVAQTNLSTCQGGPFEKLVVDNDQFLGQFCDPPPPCYSPPKPTVLADANFQRAQGVVLEATPPAWLTPIRARWYAEYDDPDLGIVLLWAHSSTEGLGQTPIQFGAPGLRANQTHYFRVAYEKSDQSWTCISPRSDPYPTGDFLNTPPTAPAPTVYEVEDDFRRPVTTIKSAGGDGLGPDAVWMESPAPVATRIASDQDSVELAQGSIAVYAGLAETHNHSFAEVQLRNAGLAAGGVEPYYNFEVTARALGSIAAGSLDGYLVKLRKENVGGSTFLKLILARGTGDSFSELPNGSLDLPTTDPADKCDEEPPLNILDPGDSFSPQRSMPVWLRIEVQDVSTPLGVKVIGTVAWGNCAGAIESCDHVCSWESTDPGDYPDSLRGKLGKRSFSGHHQSYFVLLFRAGSSVTGP